jgi:2-alkyl-3-oxoalkanoate reductase
VDGPGPRIWSYLGAHLRGAGERGFRVPVPYRLAWLFVRLAHATSRWIFRGKGKLPSILVPCRFEARFKPARYTNRKARELLGWQPPLGWRECLGRTYGPPAG